MTSGEDIFFGKERKGAGFAGRGDGGGGGYGEWWVDGWWLDWDNGNAENCLSKRLAHFTCSALIAGRAALH